MEKLKANYAATQEKHTALQNTLNNAEELLQTLLTGLSSKNAGQSGGGYMGQLADARARLAQASAEEDQSRLRIKATEKELLMLEDSWRRVEREANEGKKSLDSLKREVEKFKQKVQQCKWDGQRNQGMEDALRQARNDVRTLTDVRDIILAHLYISELLPGPRQPQAQITNVGLQLLYTPP